MKRGEISFNILDREKYGRTYIGKDVYLTRKLSAEFKAVWMNFSNKCRRIQMELSERCDIHSLD